MKEPFSFFFVQRYFLEVLHYATRVGAIPSWVGGALVELRLLDLQDNSFKGGLPVSLGALSNLAVLLLNCNYLAGIVPESFRGLENLGTRCTELHPRKYHTDALLYTVCGNVFLSTLFLLPLPSPFDCSRERTFVCRCLFQSIDRSIHQPINKSFCSCTRTTLRAT
jgi:hypothetical protein